LNSRSYDIKNVGFLKNDVELYHSKGVIYFTDLQEERIIKSGEVRIFFHIQTDDSVNDLLILFFLHYSTQEFNYIGGDGD